MRERESQRRPGGRSKVAIGAGAALGATALAAPGAEAATFTVANLNNDGPGSLHDAVENQANATSGIDTVVFQSGLSGQITLTDTIDVTEGIEIQGPGAAAITVSGDKSRRILHLYGLESADQPATISGLTLRNGYSATGGGAIYNGPGAGEAADLTLTGVAILDGYSNGRGGAVYNLDGDLDIANSGLSGNEAHDSLGGAVFSDGGRVTIAASAITGNTAAEGGGVYVEDTPGSSGDEVVVSDSLVSGNQATVSYNGGLQLVDVDGGILIERSTITANSAAIDGGALQAESSNPDARVLIDSSTIAGNSAGETVGAVILDGEAPTTLRSSTVSGNTAGTRFGGIVHTGGADTTLTIESSTIVGNSQANPLDGDGAGVHRQGLDSGAPGDDTVILRSTIVADNGGGADLGETYHDGSFELGFSLVGDTGTATVTEAPAGSNLFGLDPQLGPLAQNGGPTETHAPAQSSPAIDKGVANGLANDQRGLARTGDLSAFANAAGGDGTDIGSVELQAADCQGQMVFSVTGTAGNDTLTGDAGSNAIFGGAGDDSLNGVEGNDCLFGADGADAADGGAGDDLVDGGAGRDGLAGGAGKDNVSGQAGRDNARAGPGKDKVKGSGGKDKLKGNGGPDRLKGGPGKDNLKGGGGKDRLSGGGGKDRLNGGGGKDRVKGGPGKDRLKAAGGGKDRVNCGGGKDKARIDAKDKVSRNCEKVVEDR